jgi:hypothetical protein
MHHRGAFLVGDVSISEASAQVNNASEIEFEEWDDIIEIRHANHDLVLEIINSDGARRRFLLERYINRLVNSLPKNLRFVDVGEQVYSVAVDNKKGAISAGIDWALPWITAGGGGVAGSWLGGIAGYEDLGAGLGGVVGYKLEPLLHKMSDFVKSTEIQDGNRHVLRQYSRNAFL